MSCAGREVLVKANAQAVLTTYPMSFFKISAKVYQKMTHWQCWPNITRLKHEGGMGFRELSLFNKPLLGKQGWWLMTRPEALCTRLIKGKCFPNGNFLTATMKRNSSHNWKAMVYGQYILQRGVTIEG